MNLSDFFKTKEIEGSINTPIFTFMPDSLPACLSGARKIADSRKDLEPKQRRLLAAKIFGQTAPYELFGVVTALHPDGATIYDAQLSSYTDQDHANTLRSRFKTTISPFLKEIQALPEDEKIEALKSGLERSEEEQIKTRDSQVRRGSLDTTHQTYHAMTARAENLRHLRENLTPTQP